jgi:UDP-3-O-[3-hydroxymyristoyl] glucosamine N-acyltransferase
VPIPLADIAARVGATLDGDGALPIARVATLHSATSDAIAFLANPRYRKDLETSAAGAVIVSPAMARHSRAAKLISSNPYATYAKVAQLLHPRAPVVPGIHATAVVAQGARIAASASIGPRVCIGENAVIGERVSIGAGCVIGDQCEIAEDALLHANVTLYAGCRIGARTIVHSGAVIGADGFGMANEGGRWIKIPQVGRVLVGSDVEIGANTTIDRGAIEDTVIGDDVKLDNQIQIGHNCTIGEHTAIAGCVGIAGSAHIGRNCLVGGAAMIGGHLHIADGSTVSGGTPVFNDIRTPGVYTAVLPTLPHREWRRMASALRKLGVAERAQGDGTHAASDAAEHPEGEQ